MLSSDTFLHENRHIISLAKKTLDTLVSSSSIDHLVLLREWNILHTYIGNAAASASLMVNVHPDKDMREAGETIEQEVQQFATALGLAEGSRHAFKSTIGFDTIEKGKSTGPRNSAKNSAEGGNGLRV